MGGKSFAVPQLPLRHNRVVYPLCRDLSATEGADTRRRGRAPAESLAQKDDPDSERRRIDDLAQIPASS
jgi:hypothetical protein